MVTINHELKPFVGSLELYNSDDKSLGFVKNEAQFYNVRKQIAEQQLKGYYFLAEVDGTKRKCVIKSNGRLEYFPVQFMTGPIEFEEMMNTIGDWD